MTEEIAALTERITAEVEEFLSATATARVIAERDTIRHTAIRHADLAVEVGKQLRAVLRHMVIPPDAPTDRSELDALVGMLVNPKRSMRAALDAAVERLDVPGG